MASHVVANPAVQLKPVVRIPRTFKEAIFEGWKIVSEQSKSNCGRRCGSVTLSLNGIRAIVSYVADDRGYRFSPLTEVCSR